MMKKNYTFLILIFLMFYLLYNILNNEYWNYVNNKIKSNYNRENNLLIKENQEKQEEANYKNTAAFKDMMLKTADKWNHWEKLFKIVTEKNYKKFTNTNLDVIVKEVSEINLKPYDWMTVFEKWIYLIFNKDLRED
jgi:hypothetical protein